MEAKALTPRDLFDGKVCYEIPPFQRPYVWTEEDQWQPLWDDIARVAERTLHLSGDPKAVGAITGHFLGAVVVKQLPSASGDPLRSSVIDGLQRLTTLQLLLDAAQLVMEETESEDLAETLQELVLNDSKRFRKTAKRFKLWPSRIDRAAFEAVMDNELAIPADIADSRISQAHEFFRAAIAEWADVTGDPAKSAARLAALAQVLQQHLQIVAIDLSGGDDDQLIFETLNDRGTPLLAADLIKNYVFQRCEELGADVDQWSETYWRDFDDDWWRDQVSQGRLYRSRIDLFLQYWLTMRIKDEIPTDAVFGRFRTYADEQLASTDNAEEFLAGLRLDADAFREFAQLDPRSARGSFHSRVVESLELGAFIPLLLWLISEEHATSQEQRDRALLAVESWAVRRTLLRRTMKDVNKLVVALLKELDLHAGAQLGDAAVEYLRAQTADARIWPTDDDLLSELPSVRVYGNIKQQRLRAILAGVELQLRTERHEEVSLPTKLDIEHVMPQGWRSHWDDGTAADHEAAAARDHRSVAGTRGPFQPEDGREFAAPSRAAMEAASLSAIDGWSAWTAAETGASLFALRQSLLAAVNQAIETPTEAGEGDEQRPQSRHAMLTAARESADAGNPHRMTVRQLLSMWGAKGRGHLVVDRVAADLENYSLETRPDFRKVSIHSMVELIGQPTAPDDVCPQSSRPRPPSMTLMSVSRSETCHRRLAGSPS